jgi:transcription initiation factor IIF auxiliary subunit
LNTKNFLLIIFIALSVTGKAQRMRDQVQRAHFKTEKVSTYSNGVSKWTIKIDNKNSPDSLIDHVVYNLDGTRYKDPVRTVTEADYQIIIFGASGTDVMAEVFFTDGTSEKYFFPLSVNEITSFNLENTSQRQDENVWKWQAFITGDEEELNAVSYVEYTLHRSFKNRVVIINERGADKTKGFELKASGWGTFNLKAKVVTQSGNVTYLEHELSFSVD